MLSEADFFMARLEEVEGVVVAAGVETPGGDANIVKNKGTAMIVVISCDLNSMEIKLNILLSQYITPCFIYGFSKLFYFIALLACSDCENTNSSEKISVISYVINCALRIHVMHRTAIT